MTQFSRSALQRGWRANEIVSDVLTTSVLVLAGIIAVVQFAYY